MRQWEYKVIQYAFIIGSEDQQHMNDLGNNCWELFHQAVVGKPYENVVCTFKRRKQVRVLGGIRNRIGLWWKRRYKHGNRR